MVQGNIAASVGTDPSTVNGQVMRLCRCLCACSFWDRGLGALGFASQGQDSLPLGGGVVPLLRLKMSLAFSEGFECLGSWCLRPLGVMSCLPSEGAGSGARPHLLSVPELCRYLAESWLTFQIHLQELLQYKRQNPAQVNSPMSYTSSQQCGEVEMEGWEGVT